MEVGSVVEEELVVVQGMVVQEVMEVALVVHQVPEVDMAELVVMEVGLVVAQASGVVVRVAKLAMDTNAP
ncbi:hypothetical protein B296_00054663 [Ensete ventricosum]|uniref:Uncharacterized protein n=1 Tax=Ensete ventricosum TaxID=4639 RepID=A0A426Y2T8_ENSVE|nr:hypothetical protein B296_00054663 [Ensete ventricosum]